VAEKSEAYVRVADIITNSAHLRPLDAQTVGWMKPGAVVPLMYEAWEFRPEDVDLEACRDRGIALGGVNECHPNIDVFSFLGPLAVKLLQDAGIAVYKSRVLVLCDNPFAPYIERGLAGLGADIEVCDGLDDAPLDCRLDAVLVAMRPRPQAVLGVHEVAQLARSSPHAVLAQFWGDVERDAASVAGLRVWPLEGPARGHMGILLSALGPEPIVRLQTGGLKVGEELLRMQNSGRSETSDYVQPLVDL
jgi:hypothetical protein